MNRFKATIRPVGHRIHQSSVFPHNAVAEFSRWMGLPEWIPLWFRREAHDLIQLSLNAMRRPAWRSGVVISDKNRYIWMVNPKVASTSIRSSLLKMDPSARLIYTCSLEDVHWLNPKSTRYLTAAFVRSPYSRVVSYYYDKHHKSPRQGQWITNIYYQLSIENSFKEVCEWLCTPFGSDDFADIHWMSQHRIIQDNDGKLPDFVGRFESLDDDWNEFIRMTGLSSDPPPLVRANESANLIDNVSIQYDPRLSRLIYERYATDFEKFGYEKSHV